MPLSPGLSEADCKSPDILGKICVYSDHLGGDHMKSYTKSISRKLFTKFCFSSDQGFGLKFLSAAAHDSFIK